MINFIDFDGDKQTSMGFFMFPSNISLIIIFAVFLFIIPLPKISTISTKLSTGMFLQKEMVSRKENY